MIVTFDLVGRKVITYFLAFLLQVEAAAEHLDLGIISQTFSAGDFEQGWND